MKTLRELATAATPGPWEIIPDCYDGKEEAYCYWHKVGPFCLDDKEPDANSEYLAACSPDAILALLDERDALRAALEGVIPWVVTQEFACHGMKCREALCQSCSGDTEAAAERACEAYQAAHAAMKAKP